MRSCAASISRCRAAPNAAPRCSARLAAPRTPRPVCLALIRARCWRSRAWRRAAVHRSQCGARHEPAAPLRAAGAEPEQATHADGEHGRPAREQHRGVVARRLRGPEDGLAEGGLAEGGLALGTARIWTAQVVGLCSLARDTVDYALWVCGVCEFGGGSVLYLFCTMMISIARQE